MEAVERTGARPRARRSQSPSTRDAEFRMATDHVAAYHQVLHAVDHMKQARVHPTRATLSIVITAAGFAGLPHQAPLHVIAQQPLLPASSPSTLRLQVKGGALDV